MKIVFILLTLLVSLPQAWADTPTPVTPGVPVHLNHNRINPLQGEAVEIQGLTAQHQRVNIRVYTQSGTLVKELLKDAEPLAVPAWDGRNSRGEVVATGVYVIIVTGYKLEKHFRIAVIK